MSASASRVATLGPVRNSDSRTRVASVVVHVRSSRDSLGVEDIAMHSDHRRPAAILLCLSSLVAVSCSKPAEPLSKNAIQVAAAAGDTAGVQQAIDAGFGVDTLGRNSATPMFAAVTGNKAEMVRFLAKKGAKVDAMDGSDRAPLHYAAQNGFVETVTALIDSGANPDIRNIYGYTPLIAASMDGRVEIVRLLIARGASVNLSDLASKTPLHFALKQKQDETARALVELGADVNAVDREGRRPLTEAKARGDDPATIDFLIAHGAHE
jgi:ankyrin repeat protein